MQAGTGQVVGVCGAALAILIQEMAQIDATLCRFELQFDRRTRKPPHPVWQTFIKLAQRNTATAGAAIAT